MEEDITYNKPPEEELKKVLELKSRLEESDIDISNLVYMPEVPIPAPFPRQFMIEKWHGVTVARLVAPSDDLDKDN